MPALTTLQSTASGAVDATPAQGREKGAVPAWLPLGLVLLMASYLSVRAANPITDPDTWWQLRLGEEFRNGWSLPDPGRLSTFADRPWFATQWTLEVLASRLVDTFGLVAVSWLTGVGVLLLAAAVLSSCRGQGAALPASVATGLVLVAVIPTIAPRPQMLSFILLAVFMGAWLRTADDLRPRWWLVPLSWVWACSHGMWFTGVVVAATVIVGLLLDRRLSLRREWKLIAVPVASIVAAALTPVGPKLLLAPLTTAGAAPYVSEWQPPDFRYPAAATAGVLLVAVVVAWGRRPPVSWSRLLLLVVAGGWTVLSLRTVPLGAIMAAPLLAGALHAGLFPNAPRPVARSERLWTGAGLAVAVVVLTLVVPLTSRGDFLPSRLSSAVAALPQGTVLYNDYGLGGWLSWEHRNVVPVIDGMTDAYYPEYIGRFKSAAALGPGWERFFASTGADYALLEITSPMAIDLQHHGGWDEIARGRGYILLERG